MTWIVWLRRYVFEKQQAIFKVADRQIKESQVKQKEQYKKRRGVIDYKLLRE